MIQYPVCVLEAQNTLGECPVWDDVAQALYWTDITECTLHRFDPASRRRDTWRTPSELGSFALRRSQPGMGQPGMIGGFRTGFGLFEPEAGVFRTLHAPEADQAGNRMNDGKCDPRGRFWCGSIHEVSDPALRQPIASVYRLGADYQLDHIRAGVKTSNGFAWSPDGGTMYFTDTPTLQILAFDYDCETGSLSGERIFATVPPGCGRPDGATVDTEGCLWSAHFAGWRITRYSPDGTVLQVVPMPVANVTSCTFGGADLDTLYITTAREDLSEKELKQQPLAGGLFALKPSVHGLPANRFAG